MYVIYCHLFKEVSLEIISLISKWLHNKIFIKNRPPGASLLWARTHALTPQTGHANNVHLMFCQVDFQYRENCRCFTNDLVLRIFPFSLVNVQMKMSEVHIWNEGKVLFRIITEIGSNIKKTYLEMTKNKCALEHIPEKHRGFFIAFNQNM